MKCLTLNAHSFRENLPLKRLFDLAEHILEVDYDIICLQEINQRLETAVAGDLENFTALSDFPKVHEDNYALYLVNYLKNTAGLTTGLGFTIISAMMSIMKGSPFYQRHLLKRRICSFQTETMSTTTTPDVSSLLQLLLKTRPSPLSMSTCPKKVQALRKSGTA